jgi:hypothetical protein
MSKLLLGFVLGICVATVGFTGIAHIGDRAVLKIQDTVRAASAEVR